MTVPETGSEAPADPGTGRERLATPPVAAEPAPPAAPVRRTPPLPGAEHNGSNGSAATAPPLGLHPPTPLAPPAVPPLPDDATTAAGAATPDDEPEPADEGVDALVVEPAAPVPAEVDMADMADELETDDTDDGDLLDSDLEDLPDLDDLGEVDEVADEDVELLDGTGEPAAGTETDEIELLAEDEEPEEGELPAFQVRQLADPAPDGATPAGRGRWQRPTDAGDDDEDDLQQWVAHPTTTAAVANAATRAAALASASEPRVIDNGRRHPVLRGLLVLVLALLVLAAGVGAGYLFTALSGR